MLPKKNRIKTNLFQETQKKSDRFFYKNDIVSLSISFLGIKGQEETKFAVVIPKKVVGKAIQRNKLKRVIFSILEKYIKNIKLGYNIIIKIQKIDVDLINRDILKEPIKDLLIKSSLFLK